MGDERSCPDCGERLNIDARRCVCGWGAKKAKDNGKTFDHVCTYKAGFDRCQYPVGLFKEGSTHGWCIFHRQELQAGQGAEIVRQSHVVPYLEAIKPIIEGNKQSGLAMSQGIKRKPEDTFQGKYPGEVAA